jgi:DNA-binding transcriptional regulator YhcF (GntR family)
MVSMRHKKKDKVKKPTSQAEVKKLTSQADLKKTPTQGTDKKPTAPATGAPKEVKEGLRQLQQRWGTELVAAGWVALPTIILERQDALGLDPLDINVILHIAKHWFEAGNLPHPSKGSIAKAMQVTPRTIQKRFSKLDGLGFVQRIERRGPKGTKGSQTSKFDFSGLIKEATPFAVEALRERKEKREATLARLGRKRPRVDQDDGESP